jgi:hypothetical protein
MFSQTLRMWRIDLLPEAPGAAEPAAARPAPPPPAATEQRSRFENLRILPRPDDDC